MDAYGSSVVICSPEALRKNTTCACRLCPLDTCVSRNALAALDLDHALGVGSGRDSDALREFYRLTANASLVTNVPISEGHTTKREEMWGSLVDVVMSFLKTVKPPLKMKPCARPPSPKCADALMVPPYQYAGAPACRAAFVGSIQPTKIPLTFFQKFDKEVFWKSACATRLGGVAGTEGVLVNMFAILYRERATQASRFLEGLVRGL